MTHRARRRSSCPTRCSPRRAVRPPVASSTSSSTWPRSARWSPSRSCWPPRSGRATPRMAETPSGMLNSIGLQGPGIDAFLENDLPWLHERGARAVVSIAGGSVEEYAELADRLRGAPGLTAIEVNISCPNVDEPRAGLRLRPRRRRGRGQRRAAARPPVGAGASPSSRPTSPTSSTIARAVRRRRRRRAVDDQHPARHGVDLDTMRPVLAGVTGGLSGPAIRPVAVRCVWQVHAALPDVPILGMGGVRTGLDALELILAGASAVSVGTAVFDDPTAPARVLRELRDALAARGFATVADAVGYAHRPARPARRRRGGHRDDRWPTRPGADRGRPRRARPRDGAALGRGGRAVREHREGRARALPARTAPTPCARPARSAAAATCSSTSSCTTSRTPSPVRPARSPSSRRPTSPSTRPAVPTWCGPPSRRCPHTKVAGVTVLTSLSDDRPRRRRAARSGARRRAPARGPRRRAAARGRSSARRRRSPTCVARWVRTSR